LVGLTNGMVGPLGKRFSTKSAAAARTTRKWFASGTNAAIFEIRNPRNGPIYLANVCRFQTRGDSAGLGEEIPLLTQGALIIVSPRESVVAEVPILPHDDPWRIRFIYFQAEESFRRKILDWLREHVASLPVQTESYTMESDWMMP